MISAVGGVDGLGGAFGDLAEAGHDRGKRKKKRRFICPPSRHVIRGSSTPIHFNRVTQTGGF